MNELLLTPEELTELEIDFNGNVYGIINFPKLVAKAQLAKAEPLIRKDEREGIIKLADKYMPARFMTSLVKALKGEK